MASGRGAPAQRETTFRRVAIVLQSLPAPVAAQLMQGFEPESRGRLKLAMDQLSDVDPMERQLALQSFKGSIRTNFQSSSSDAVRDEFVVSQRGANREEASSHIDRTSRLAGDANVASAVNRDDKVGPNSAQQKSDANSPLGFLNQVSDQPLADLLASEHPQTIALVLASIAPSHAARVLPRLTQELREATMSRIGRLGTFPEDSLADIAEHLRSRVEAETDDQPSSGQRALNAILAELSSSGVATGSGTDPVREASRPDTHQHEAFAQMLRLNQIRSGSTKSDHRDPDPEPTQRNVPNAGANVSDLPLDERAGSHPTVAGEFGDNASVKPSGWQEQDRFSDSGWSNEAVDQHLMSLPPKVLCEALGRLETRQALLTLCGLPSKTAESVLAVLPRAREKIVRRQLANLGSLRLRDIDAAKLEAAKLTSNEPTTTAARGSLTSATPLAA